MILATWAPIFALVSGTANAYVMHFSMQRVHSREARREVLRDLLLRGFSSSIMLYLFSIANMLFFHHSMRYNGVFRHTLITSTIVNERFHSYSRQLLFYNDALSLIALTGIITTLTLYFLWREGGFTRVRRNYIVLAMLIGSWLVLSPFLQRAFNPVFHNALDNGNYPLAFCLKLLIGPNLCPFPTSVYGLVGVGFGMALAQGTAIKTLRRYGYGGGLLLLGIGLVHGLIQGVQVSDLAAHIFPMKFHYFNLGLMTCLATFLIDKIEYQPEARRAVMARRTFIFRRVGMAALSVFMMESLFAAIISKPYAWLWPGEGFPHHPVAVGLFLLLLLSFWNLALWAWSKHDFKYGCEWLMVQVTGIVRGKRSIRLNAGEILDRPCDVSSSQGSR